MICPSCGDEYQPGIVRCTNCDVDLIEPPPQPPEPPPLEIVTVLATGDPVKMEMAKSLLTSAGVDFWVKGDGLQDLFGAGRVGAGFNLTIGPMLLQVDVDDEADARAVLSEVPPDGSDDADT